MSDFEVMIGEGQVPVKLWNSHVTIEKAALLQLAQVAQMPFVRPYIAAMPDTHWGMGATVGSVIPTEGAIMPAAVGVDIGCGMMAVRTNLQYANVANLFMGGGEIGDDETKSWLQFVFNAISKAVPHGRTNDGGAGDRGAWGEVPPDIRFTWMREFGLPYSELAVSHPGMISKNAERHLGTLGTGNHFIEVCRQIDNDHSNLWIVIHSGSRGLGNRIGTYFTKLAGELCKKWGVALPNKDLGYLPQGTQECEDYIAALDLAQKFAWRNREIMMSRVLTAIGAKESDSYLVKSNSPIDGDESIIPNTIHMHHNYMTKYAIKNKIVNLTRKGAVDASLGNWVIIPGSMGAKTYIARGLGNPESFNSCSHGAGRAMSRTQALKTFTLEQHAAATEGVVCDKTRGVLDETPASYKDIDAVMESQRDLVEPVLKLKQLICVKGISE